MTPVPAPLTIRTPAFLLDQVVVTCLVVPPVLGLGVEFGTIVSPGEPRQLVFVALMAVAFAYHFLAEWLTGRTLGKELFNLRVLADDGSALGLRGSFLRNALRLIDGLGYWSVAVFVILLRGDGKRIGDVVGRTLVVQSD
ncbi:RDD family protein [Natronoarchaeum sp. GCM10025321]|uniref:RDD family protein n=1 Tax=Natronoarchaeum sp. GCM10025321 TaxID=3252684 RepID=UPI003616BE7E